MQHIRRSAISLSNRCSGLLRSQNGLSSLLELKPVSDVGLAAFSSSRAAMHKTAIGNSAKWVNDYLYIYILMGFVLVILCFLSQALDLKHFFAGFACVCFRFIVLTVVIELKIINRWAKVNLGLETLTFCYKLELKLVITASVVAFVCLNFFFFLEENDSSLMVTGECY